MNDSGISILLADLVLAVHFAFVAFVVAGLAAIAIGRFFGWRWIYHRFFRVAHVAGIGVVVIQTYLGRLCPLTIVENRLRAGAGQENYDESFVQYWLQRVLYYDLEPWIFVALYSLFGLLVLAAIVIDWGRIFPRRQS